MPAVREVSVELTVNGTLRSVVVPARTLLVHFLRDHLGLTGTATSAATPRSAAPARWHWTACRG